MMVDEAGARLGKCRLRMICAATSFVVSDLSPHVL
jgi:hypothetical protein